MRARPLLSVVGAIGMVGVVTQTSCLALLCYEDETCAEGSGGGSTTALTASQASTSQDATALTATQSAGGGNEGGAGGGPPCDMSILLSDPENCGDCGHDCAGGACLQGVCQPFSIDTEQSTMSRMGPIAVFQDRVYVVVTGGETQIKSLPVEFESEQDLEYGATVSDTGGKWGRGPEFVYYAPQLLNLGNRIYYCRPGQGCGDVPLTETDHVVGTAAIGNQLYMAVSGTNKVRSLVLDDGVPLPNSEEDVITSVDKPASGVHEMFADLSGRIVFTTFARGGCIYREDPTAFQSPAVCDSDVGMIGGGIGALASDPQGTPYVATTLPNPALMFAGGAPINIGGASILPPISVDENFIYASSGVTAAPGLVILDKATGSLIVEIGDDVPSAIDATHPDYVFYGVMGATLDQNRIYRLRKPLVADP